MTRSAGQKLAHQQLEEICGLADGAISITDIVEPTEGAPSLKVRIGLSTIQHDRAEGGLRLRGREPIEILIPSSFPHDYPWVDVPHKRFAGAPHVQWATHICLYRSPDIEWAPADGMYGFIERLNRWFGAAALGELDPDDAPLHPPVIYGQGSTRIVAKANTPEVPKGSAVWHGTAVLQPVHKTRMDLVGWGNLAEDVQEGYVTAAAILMGAPFPIEYPTTVKGIIAELEKQGVEYLTLYLLMQVQVAKLAQGQGLHIVIGTPMRRRDANGPLRQHLAVWRIEDEATEALRTILDAEVASEMAIRAFVEWSVTAKIEWCRVDEAREEVTLKRDGNSDAAWLHGKRVLLLGCGALGSYMGDMLVRAGTAMITLVDNDVVSNGIISRQLFCDIDIGKAKAAVCRDRLKSIAPACQIDISVKNLKTGVLKNFGREFDLVIDATASRAVSSVLEQELQEDAQAPALLSMSVSAKAEIGRVVMRPGNFTGGPKSIVRNAKLATHANPKYSGLARAFWPKPGEMELFQPEPGCSEPTFEGSATDIAFHAAGLLNIGLAEVGNNNFENAAVAFLPKPLLKIGNKVMSVTRFEFTSSRVDTERNHAYSVLSSPAVVQSVSSEITRSARCNGTNFETGGLLFGQIDDSLNRIWVDRVSGPPPDSILSPELFVCGTDGTNERAALQKKRSGGSSQFIGIWHTHPVSPPRPSDVDLGAMRSILLQNENPPRHTVMLIIGHAAAKPDWAFYIFRRNELKLMKRQWRIVVRLPNGT